MLCRLEHTQFMVVQLCAQQQQLTTLTPLACIPQVHHRQRAALLYRRQLPDAVQLSRDGGARAGEGVPVRGAAAAQ